MDNIFFFKLDEEVEEEDEVEVEEDDELEEEDEDELDEEEDIQCDNCNETIVLAKNGVFILSRIRELSSSYPLNVEDSLNHSKYDELCWCQNCFENNWKIMRDDLWECDDFEQFEDDDDSEKKNI